MQQQDKEANNMELWMPRGLWGSAKLKNDDQHATLRYLWLHLSKLSPCHEDGSEIMTLPE